MLPDTFTSWNKFWLCCRQRNRSLSFRWAWYSFDKVMTNQLVECLVWISPAWSASVYNFILQTLLLIKLNHLVYLQKYNWKFREFQGVCNVTAIAFQLHHFQFLVQQICFSVQFWTFSIRRLVFNRRLTFSTTTSELQTQKLWANQRSGQFHNSSQFLHFL